MQKKRQSSAIERICFILFLMSFVFFSGFVIGKIQASTPAKVCATVPGERVISTTEDFCTYANAYGLSLRKRRALKGSAT